MEENLHSQHFYFKESKKVTPYPDSSLDGEALTRLDWLKQTFENQIPSQFLSEWSDVKLYNPRGKVGEAFGLLLNPDDGAFDVRNSLNNLTGKEWVKFTSSWFIFNALASDLKEEKSISPELATHPATYSPTMIEGFIRFFTKEGMTVLDPFAGIGSTLVAAKRTGRFGIGIELNKKYADLANLRFSGKDARVINANSMDLDKLGLSEIDFAISSPPYWDVLNRSTKDFKKTRDSKDLDVTYSDSDLDLGNLHDYEDFISQLTAVYDKVHDVMRPGAFNVVIIKNVKKDGKFYPLAWDLARSMSQKWEIKDEKIWIQDKVGLAPYGYPHSWASNIIHHYCLVFQKRK
jgi:DNA modification methylase